MAAVSKRDYYEILGVDRNVSDDDLKKAYRKLARQHHPDLHVGDQQKKSAEEKFKEINEAYEVLSNEEKRKEYDELGAQWEQYARQGQTREQAGAARSGTYGAGRMRPEDLEDLFGGASPFSDFYSTYWGGEAPHARAQEPRRGSDLEHPLDVTLEEAAHGGTRRLRLEGADGQVRAIEVTIPPGVRDGTRIRVAGQGAEGRNGGPRGDLYLVVEVAAHPDFERRGDDLYTTVQAPLTAMLLGGEVPVRTLDKRVLLKIPEATADGKTFRLRGQGMPKLNHPDERGDLYAEVHAQMPGRLTEEQRRLIEEFARLQVGETAGAH